LDVNGEALGIPCFFSDLIAGESLLKPMIAGETWAEEVYLDAVCALQSVCPTDLGEAFTSTKQEAAEDILGDSWAYFKDHPLPLAETIYQNLSATKPKFPPLRFSNGDLWLENFTVRDNKLTGVIDFQGAAFSNPIFEFLLSFFVEPGLQGRWIEVR
jgi:aminoglycoside phosphotransferase (APT) family kinase protein